MCIRDSLNPTFAFVIQSAGGLIQDQDRRILKEYTCNGNPLLLSAGKACATFSDISVVFIRKLHDKVMDTRTFGGFDDLFIGSSGLSVGNIIRCV